MTHHPLTIYHPFHPSTLPPFHPSTTLPPPTARHPPRSNPSPHSPRINQHWFELTIVASAGTYIKEFVHGDLGRTEPSVGSLLGCEADIFQLDVLEVHTHGRLDLDLVDE